MPENAVPSDEMRWFSSERDPIDSVLSGDAGDEDLLDVAAIVHDVRAAYLPTEPLRRGPALAAFTQAHLDDADGDLAMTAGNIATPASAAVPPSGASDTERIGRKPNKMLNTVTGFLGTLTGKVLLGTAVSAASVGALHAADVVDVPALPGKDQPAVEELQGSGQGDGQGARADAGVEGQETAAEKLDAAQAYADAVRQWTDCVAAAASAQGDEEARTTGAFDPRDHCGDHPQPWDFGLTDLPSQASGAVPGGAIGDPLGQGAVPDDPGSNQPGDSGVNIPEPGSNPSGGSSNTPTLEDPASNQPGDSGVNIPEPGSNPTSGGSGAGAGGQP